MPRQRTHHAIIHDAVALMDIVKATKKGVRHLHAYAYFHLAMAHEAKTKQRQRQINAGLTRLIHLWKDDAGEWPWEKIIDVENGLHPERPIPVPGVISVILLSMDDKYLYFCNWLHGAVRQYDISDPHNPKLTGQAWIAGLLEF